MRRRRTHKFRNRAPPLSINRILAWADAHHERTGAWPKCASGEVSDAPWERWGSINIYLTSGMRGLPGGTTLARLLAERRGQRNHLDLPSLSVTTIVRWARDHFARTGSWPTRQSGRVASALGERWSAINNALIRGVRGLPGGSSLPKLLSERCGVGYLLGRPPLTHARILAWADAHFARTGAWPRRHSGRVLGEPLEDWKYINYALSQGQRGLRPGSSLLRVLAKQRGAKRRKRRPDLDLQQILAWADAHKAATGKWPGAYSGPLRSAPRETWLGINTALDKGRRGLSRGQSLAVLLERQRGVRHHMHLARFSVPQILHWAELHHQRTGRWPTRRSGQIQGVADEQWKSVDVALSQGCRGLPGGTSLARLLVEKRGVRNVRLPPWLTEERILEWASAHRARTGSWPRVGSGPVADAPGETWKNLNRCLLLGRRGLPGGATLKRLLAIYST